MDATRHDLHALAQQQRLSPPQHRALLRLLQPGVPADWPARLAPPLAVLAALLIGLALVMAVASQWGDWSRATRFVLLQALLLGLGATAVATGRRPAVQAALGLLACLGQGGLMAFFGQTYQTGADPWQLFALWALLSLPLALALRHEALWVLWSLVATLAVVLAVQTYSGRRWIWRAHDPWPMLLGVVALVSLQDALGPALRRWHGAGVWAARAQAAFSLWAISGWALVALFAVGQSLLFAALAAVLAVAVLRAWQHRDGVVLALALLAFDACLWCGLLHLLMRVVKVEPVSAAFLLAVGAAGLLVLSVGLLLRLPPQSNAPAAQGAQP